MPLVLLSPILNRPAAMIPIKIGGRLFQARLSDESNDHMAEDVEAEKGAYCGYYFPHSQVTNPYLLTVGICTSHENKNYTIMY